MWNIHHFDVRVDRTEDRMEKLARSDMNTQRHSDASQMHSEWNAEAGDTRYTRGYAERGILEALRGSRTHEPEKSKRAWDPDACETGSDGIEEHAMKTDGMGAKIGYRPYVDVRGCFSSQANHDCPDASCTVFTWSPCSGTHFKLTWHPPVFILKGNASVPLFEFGFERFSESPVRLTLGLSIRYVTPQHHRVAFLRRLSTVRVPSHPDRDILERELLAVPCGDRYSATVARPCTSVTTTTLTSLRLATTLQVPSVAQLSGWQWAHWAQMSYLTVARLQNIIAVAIVLATLPFANARKGVTTTASASIDAPTVTAAGSHGMATLSFSLAGASTDFPAPSGGFVVTGIYITGLTVTFDAAPPPPVPRSTTIFTARRAEASASGSAQAFASGPVQASASGPAQASASGPAQASASGPA
ncbi:hypothetical protein C8R44DRAFT_751067 [Mycena epipterygia]|nr:hypothetical protein C8R44DRAFT_751067 [Mycena epipterygia]